MRERDVSWPVRRIARMRVPLGFFCGAVAYRLARPTWRSLAAGGILAAAGEMLRLWAAGHLEKGKEVTRSGPYQWMRHPLYAGSALMGAGVAVASGHPLVSLLVAGYQAATFTAAVRSEEAQLENRFGDAYVKYRDGAMEVAEQAFAIDRVLRNREHRALAGLLLAIALLAAKAARGGTRANHR